MSRQDDPIRDAVPSPFPRGAPEAYREGYPRASAINAQLAREYLAWSQVGDPVADVAIKELQPRGVAEINRLIRAGMDGDEKTFAEAPDPLRDLFAEIDEPPSWWDPGSTVAAASAFHAHSDLFIPALFVSTVQNASTLIARAFYATGRVNSMFGPRRIRQNTRHFIEIMMPGGMDRHAEGWRLSVRIRLVHAQIRRLILDAGDWDERLHGVPIHAAHVGVASANFSAGMLRHATSLGASLSPEEREGFMQVWRYASWLIGTPEPLLFDGDEQRTRELWRVAEAIEPDPGHESRVIARALLDALPRIARKETESEAGAMRAHAGRVTRALIGRKLADELGLPKRLVPQNVATLRFRRRIVGMTHALLPTVAESWRATAFTFLLDSALLDDLLYRLPDELDADKASPW